MQPFCALLYDTVPVMMVSQVAVLDPWHLRDSKREDGVGDEGAGGEPRQRRAALPGQDARHQRHLQCRRHHVEHHAAQDEVDACGVMHIVVDLLIEQEACHCKRR